MTLHEGRPPVEGLSEAELACFDFLDKLGVPYFTVAHPPTRTWRPAGRWTGRWAPPCAKIFFCATGR